MQIIFKEELIEKVKTGKVIHKIVRILPAKGIAKVEHEGFSSLDDFWEVYQKPFYGWLLNFYLYREKNKKK
jgi:RNA:NAD 2'-phosphotransferase (TPT1/KptA family)